MIKFDITKQRKSIIIFKDKDKDMLIDLYINQKKSMKEIGILSEANTVTVFNALKRFNIPTRSKAGNRVAAKSPFTRAELEDLYITQQLSLSKIVKKCNLDVSPPMVSKWMRELGVPVRNYSQASLNMYDIDPSIREKVCSSKNFKAGRASKISLRYLIPLYKKLRKFGIRADDIRLGLGSNSEKYMYSEDDNRGFMYDFTIESKKILIEYQGSYYHPHFQKYSDEYLINNFKSHIFNTSERIQYIINRDRMKKKAAEKAGYKIFYLWEEDGKESINKIIDKVYFEATNKI